jgi:hypothetical protein
MSKPARRINPTGLKTGFLKTALLELERARSTEKATLKEFFLPKINLARYLHKK